METVRPTRHGRESTGNLKSCAIHYLIEVTSSPNTASQGSKQAHPGYIGRLVKFTMSEVVAVWLIRLSA